MLVLELLSVKPGTQATGSSSTSSNRLWINAVYLCYCYIFPQIDTVNKA